MRKKSPMKIETNVQVCGHFWDTIPIDVFVLILVYAFLLTWMLHIAKISLILSSINGFLMEFPYCWIYFDDFELNLSRNFSWKRKEKLWFDGRNDFKRCFVICFWTNCIHCPPKMKNGVHWNRIDSNDLYNRPLLRQIEALSTLLVMKNRIVDRVL